MSPPTIYTLGHSNRTLEELLDILRQAGIQVLVDVRAQPHSAHNPQFNREALRAAVEAAGRTYHWAGRQLGGMRPAQPGSPHVALVDDSLRAYADYMDLAAFQTAAAQLVRLATGASLAILCAERLPERCHRSLIADYLALQGVRVVHLIARGEAREHLLSAHARRESMQLVYDRHTTDVLELD